MSSIFIGDEIRLIPRLVRVDADGIELDGVRFPWAITENGVTVRSDAIGPVRITLTILADRVEVDSP